MSSLSVRQKDLLLDVYFSCATPEQLEEGRKLIASNSEAAELYSKIEESMEVLGQLKNEQCPGYLADATVAKLSEAAKNSQQNLAELLKKEQSKPITAHRSFWRRAFDVAAVAAAVIVVAAILFPTVGNMRYHNWKMMCQAGLKEIAAGFGTYANDHDGRLPQVKMTAGSPWWKVGNQDEKNQSNTRHLWLLVSEGYLEPGTFVCPAKAHGRAVILDETDISELKDFPSRKYVRYSFQLMNGRPPKRLSDVRRVLMSDMNPVFEDVKCKGGDRVEFNKVKLCEELKKINSSNHDGRGQNSLFSDGNVEFLKTRRIGPTEDDIFTVHGMEIYSGCETPAGDSDIFLVP